MGVTDGQGNDAGNAAVLERLRRDLVATAKGK